jgi:hypothetical protein
MFLIISENFEFLVPFHLTFAKLSPLITNLQAVELFSTAPNRPIQTLELTLKNRRNTGLLNIRILWTLCYGECNDHLLNFFHQSEILTLF